MGEIMRKILLTPRDLPSVEAFSQSEALARLREAYGAALVREFARFVIADAREALSGEGEGVAITLEGLSALVIEALEGLMEGGITHVINATGTVLHTNLGRALLCDEAITKITRECGAYTDLEFDLSTGARGERDAFTVSLIKRLTGCAEASVVNNNAAALLITLNTLAEGREVIISRGELIEIGGSFRIPEIIEKSGCKLREVGTTNRTHAADYINAIGENTALILKVHTSNYTIEGFTHEVSLKELVGIGAEYAVPVVEDLGSGALVDLTPYGLPHEPLVQESLSAGAVCVTFSGDKLLGGPQAGLIAGTREVVGRIKKNPLKRSLRLGKLTLTALEETLKLYLNPERLAERLPALRLMTRPLEALDKIAKEGAEIINKAGGGRLTAVVESESSVIGGGSLPGSELESRVVVIRGDISPARLQRAFLNSSPPLIGRIKRDAFILDTRTIVDNEEFFTTIKKVISVLPAKQV